jgi:UDP-galactopyranose mutase
MIKKYLIVGAGFSGAVIARCLAEAGSCSVRVIEERAHIAGNCHTERDGRTNIMIHRYGPHIFNTNRQDVWEYVNRFSEFGSYTNRVKAVIERGVFSMPINLLTINQFFGKKFSPEAARKFLAEKGDQSITNPQNFEEQALKMLGRELYEAFFYGYTKKQWGCEPRELPASILKRLPVRFNYDDNYYEARYQGIPIKGFTEMVAAILDCSGIEVKCGVTFSAEDIGRYEHVFYTGPIDRFFGFQLGRLGYRTVTFERGDAEGDYQGNAVINYPGTEHAYTRVHEHKHFAPWEKHDFTVYFREYSKETEPGETPYYPKRLGPDIEMLEKYLRLAEAQEKVSFVGRLGTYRYLNMDQAIGEALDFSRRVVEALRASTPIPKFSI